MLSRLIFCPGFVKYLSFGNNIAIMIKAVNINMQNVDIHIKNKVVVQTKQGFCPGI